MADFTKRSNFNPKANFTSVLFGANSPLLEVELNELQQIAEEKRMEIIRLLTQANPTKTLHVSKEQIDMFQTDLTSTITCPKFDIIFKNQIFNGAGTHFLPFLVSLVNNDAGSYGTIYLAYKEEVANPSTILEENAIIGGTVIENKILDTRFGSETTRRTLIKFGGIGSDAALSNIVSNGYSLEPIFTIKKVSGRLVYTLTGGAGYYTLGNYSLVTSTGSIYPALDTLNKETIATGFYIATVSTANKPINENGVAMVMNDTGTRTRMIVFFATTGRVFIKNTNTLPYSEGAWTEISPSDLSGAVLSTLLTGLTTASSADVTSSDSILTAFGKLQKKASDIVTSLSGHTSSTSNPHSVTKSQVGLGNVLNYGIATLEEAYAGTIDTKYMTPLGTKHAVRNLVPNDTSQLTKSDVYTKTEINTTVSGLNTAIGGKQATITGGASSVTSANLTANRALTSDASGKISQSAVTATELGYLRGVTSAIQTQLDAKSASTHNHTLDSLSNTTITSNSAGEILKWSGSAWINNTLSEAGIAPATHSHAIADVTGLQTALDAKASLITGGATTIATSNLATSRALVSDSSGKVAVSAVTATELSYLDGVTSSIQTQLSGKASSTHSHPISGITGLQTALDGKASTSHTHSYLPLSGGTVSGLLTASGGLKIGSVRLYIQTSAPSGMSTGDVWIDI